LPSLQIETALDH
jgi:hypothetical protein